MLLLADRTIRPEHVKKYTRILAEKKKNTLSRAPQMVKRKRDLEKKEKTNKDDQKRNGNNSNTKRNLLKVGRVYCLQRSPHNV